MRITARQIPDALRKLRGAARGWSVGRWPKVSILVWVAASVIAIFAPLLAPHAPNIGELADRLTPPFWYAEGSSEYLLGTDRQGRDVLSRIIHGSRVSITVAVLGTLIAGGVGTFLGMLAAYRQGFVDSIIMRLVDVSMAVPPLLVALALAVILGPGFWNIIYIIAFVFWGQFARQARGEALSVMARDYVAASRVAGGGGWQIMFRHVLPNLQDTMIVLATLVLGHLILLEASLSFLGVGVPPPDPSWGNMVSEGGSLIREAPWLSIAPGAALLVLVLATNLFGDWLRDHLDPRLRQV